MKDNKKGYWFTTENGRRIFVNEGESPAQALNRATGGALDQGDYKKSNTSDDFDSDYDEEFNEYDKEDNKKIGKDIAKDEDVNNNSQDLSDKLREYRDKNNMGDDYYNVLSPMSALDNIDSISNVDDATKEKFRELFKNNLKESLSKVNDKDLANEIANKYGIGNNSQEIDNLKETLGSYRDSDIASVINKLKLSNKLNKETENAIKDKVYDFYPKMEGKELRDIDDSYIASAFYSLVRKNKVDDETLNNFADQIKKWGYKLQK